MERIRTTEAVQHVGQRVKLAGWLHALRKMGSLSFLVVRDGFGTFQAVLQDVSALAHCQVESILEVEGLVVTEPQAPGGVELRDCAVRVLVPIAEPPPLSINKREIKASLDVFLNHAPVGLRHPAQRALFRIQAGLMAAFRAHLTSQGFTEVQTPKLVGSATESGANVFAVDYFGQKAYLAQSPQLYKQIMVGVLNPALYLLLQPREPVRALPGWRDAPTQGLGQLACGLGGQADSPQNLDARRLCLEQPSQHR